MQRTWTEFELGLPLNVTPPTHPHFDRLVLKTRHEVESFLKIMVHSAQGPGGTPGRELR